MLVVRTEDNKTFKQIQTPAFEDRVLADGGEVTTLDNTDELLDGVVVLNPSLVMVPSGYKASKLYSQVPYSGLGDMTVTRSGDTGMRLNNGYWQPVAANVPRIDLTWNEATQMFEQWLQVEELRTNLLPRYKSFPHSDWTKSGARIEGDPSTAGADILAGLDFTSGWTPTAPVTITNNNTFTSTAAGGLWKDVGLIAGKLYKITYAGTSTTTVGIRSSAGFNIPPNIAEDFGTYYFTAPTGGYLYIRNAAAGTTTITTLTIQEVTGYASPFVDSAGANLMDGHKLVATANNGYIRLATAITVTAATTYSNSVWIKRVTGTGQAYIIDTNTTDRAITLTTEWQRFEYAAAAGSTSGQIGVKLAVAGDEVLIAHAQLEAGATASSPIGGAEGSSQTRNADVITSAVDYSNIKTLVINNDAYVVETALPNNGYTLPQLDINKLSMFTNTLTDEQITAAGWTKKVLAFAVSVNIAAGTTVSIGVNGVGTIEWGDGTSDSYSSLVTKTHVYTGGYKGLILFTGTLTRFNTSSNANWYFNIADLPANLTYLYITGSNTITGNIANAPANLTYLYITGANTITGNIANAPANLDYLRIEGANTITGNIANAPANLDYLRIEGANTLADYTAGRVWKTNYNYLYLRQAAGAGLSSTEVDNLLINLAATTWGGSGRALDIRGVNAARTSASDAAVLSLQAQSVTVLTN